MGKGVGMGGTHDVAKDVCPLGPEVAVLDDVVVGVVEDEVRADAADQHVLHVGVIGFQSHTDRIGGPVVHFSSRGDHVEGSVRKRAAVRLELDVPRARLVE